MGVGGAAGNDPVPAFKRRPGSCGSGRKPGYVPSYVCRRNQDGWGHVRPHHIIGIPVGFESCIHFSNIVIQSSINSFGTDTVAAWSAYGKIDGTFWIVMNSFGIAITTFVGQNSGPG